MFQGEDSLKSDTEGLTLHTFPLDVTKDESVAEARKFVDNNLKPGISDRRLKEFFKIVLFRVLGSSCECRSFGLLRS